MLVSALKATKRDAAIAICGLAASTDLHATVLLFILRGATLYGVDSVPVLNEERKRIWGSYWRASGSWRRWRKWRGR